MTFDIERTIASMFAGDQRAYELRKRYEHLQRQDAFVRTTLLTDAQRARLVAWRAANPPPSSSALADRFRRRTLAGIAQQNDPTPHETAWKPHHLEQLPLVRAVQASCKRQRT